MRHLQVQILLLSAIAVSVNARLQPPSVDCTAKDPAPTGLTCGQNGPYGAESPNPLGGAIFGPALADQLYVTALEHCRDACARKATTFFGPANSVYVPGCLSFGYNDESNLCKLYTKTAAERDFIANSSVATVVYDYGCFDCPSACAQTPDAQLLDNPGFEFSTEVVGPWYTYGELKQSIAHPGHHSLTAWKCHVPPNTPANHYCNLVQHVPICYTDNDPPGPRYYALAFDYKGVPVKGGSGSHYVPFFADEFSANVSSALAGKWHRITSISRNISPSETDKGFSVGCISPGPKCAGDVYLDNVKVYAVSGDISTVAGAQSIVTNGGFESGVLAPWKLPPLERGNKFVKLVSPGLHGLGHAIQWRYTKNYPDFLIKQTILTVVGTKYLFTAQVYASAGRNPWSVFLGIGQGAQALKHNVYARGREQLVTIEHPFIAFEKSTVLSLSSTAVGTGNVTFDNISVKEAVF